MSREPSHLREVADALRAMARAFTLDVAGLAEHGGPATWLGPAAEQHRAEAAVVAAGARGTAAEMRATATRLDQQASQIAAERHRAEAGLALDRAAADGGGGR